VVRRLLLPPPPLALAGALALALAGALALSARPPLRQLELKEQPEPSGAGAGSACLPLALSAADARMAGQRDAGMATVDHTPHGRGYDTSFGYFHHGPPLPHTILCRAFSL